MHKILHHQLIMTVCKTMSGCPRGVSWNCSPHQQHPKEGRTSECQVAVVWLYLLLLHSGMLSLACRLSQQTSRSIPYKCYQWFAIFDKFENPFMWLKFFFKAVAWIINDSIALGWIKNIHGITKVSCYYFFPWDRKKIICGVTVTL